MHVGRTFARALEVPNERGTQLCLPREGHTYARHEGDTVMPATCSKDRFPESFLLRKLRYFKTQLFDLPPSIAGFVTRNTHVQQNNVATRFNTHRILLFKQFDVNST